LNYLQEENLDLNLPPSHLYQKKNQDVDPNSVHPQ